MSKPWPGGHLRPVICFLSALQHIPTFNDDMISPKLVNIFLYKTAVKKANSFLQAKCFPPFFSVPRSKLQTYHVNDSHAPPPPRPSQKKKQMRLDRNTRFQ